jgi:hypothetical protein
MLSMRQARADAFIDFGVHGSHVEADVPTFDRVTTTESGLHVGAGLRRELTRGSIGARLELDDVDGNLFLAVRALDYRRHLSQRFAVTAFAGAARLDLATPAYGYYLGVGGQWKELWPAWSLSVDYRYGDKIARDNLLPTDPPPSPDGQNDSFYDLSGISVYLSRRF